MTRRRAPNLTEKTAACLLMLKRGEDWLIPEPIRSTGTAEEICKAVEWDHAFLHALGGDTRPQNITPLRKADHKEKSRKDNGIAAKSKRLTKKEEEFRARLLAKASGDKIAPASQGKKQKIHSRNNLTKQARADAAAWKERVGR